VLLAEAAGASGIIVVSAGETKFATIMTLRPEEASKDNEQPSIPALAISGTAGADMLQQLVRADPFDTYPSTPLAAGGLWVTITPHSQRRALPSGLFEFVICALTGAIAGLLCLGIYYVTVVRRSRRDRDNMGPFASDEERRAVRWPLHLGYLPIIGN